MLKRIHQPSKVPRKQRGNSTSQNPIGKDYSFESNDDNKFQKYARIGQVAAVLGDCEVIQYLSEIDDNPPGTPPCLFVRSHKFKLECISIILIVTHNWKGATYSGQSRGVIIRLDSTCLDSPYPKGATMKMLKWLHAQGLPWGDFTLADAASRGDLKIMKWLREMHCPWDDCAF